MGGNGMKRLCMVALVLCAFFAAPGLGADDFKWNLVNALTKNDIQTSKSLIQEHTAGMSDAEKRLVVNFVLNYTRGENTKKLLEFLNTNSVSISQFDLYTALNRSHEDGVIQFILDQGIPPNGEILLLAAEKQRFGFVRKFAEMGADVNYRYPQNKAYADGMTALLYAARWNNFELVQFLVERGANINWYARDGSSAASIAYENGHMPVYTYLKEKGADFEPEQAVQTVPDANALPLRTSGGTGVSALLNSQAPALRNGTYRLPGNAVEISLAGNANPGTIRYINSLGKESSGFFLVDGSILTLVMEGRSFTYRIVSDASFSGNGETWVRTGD
jgi:hypothetical protein